MSTLTGHAQGELRLRLSEPDLASFPFISVYAQVLDESGVRVEGLERTDFSLDEDGAPISDFILEEESVGAQLIYALNTDVGLRIRDSLGRSRFDLARQALLSWWIQPAFSQLNTDDLTLLTSDTVIVRHSDSAAELASALDQATPVFTEADTGYELLFRALDYVSDEGDERGMPRSLIFITSLLRQPRDIPLTNIITRARSTGTAIYPVLIGTVEETDRPELEILMRLAQETGGQFLQYNEADGLQPLADLLLSHRQQYRLTYKARAAESGPHEVRVGLEDEGASDARSYVLEIAPAEVVLLNTPGSVQRTSKDPEIALDALPPTSIEFEYAFSFPDGYLRSIVASQLTVDGTVVAQDSEPPFDTLTWDLRPILETSTHTVQVSVMDEIGLEGLSSPAEITIEVQLPARGLTAIRPALGSLLLALGVLLVGVLFAALLFTSRRPRLPKPAPTETVRPAILRRTALKRELPEEPAEAFLVPLGVSTPETDFIPLIGTDTTLGRDPSHAAVPIDDPSVDRMHARLIRQADGVYLIRDQGSTAGTWVNYQEVPTSGLRIDHGDVVHLGAAGFRFELAAAPAPRRIRVRPEYEQPDTADNEGDQNP